MASRRTPALPDRIYLIGTVTSNSDRCFTSIVSDPSGVDINIATGTPEEYLTYCEVTVEYLPNNPDVFYLRTCKGGYFQFNSNTRAIESIDYKPTKEFPERAIPFTLLDPPKPEAPPPGPWNRNSNPGSTYLFRASNGKFLGLSAYNHKYATGVLKVGPEMIGIEDSTVKKLIGNIVYALQSSKVDVLTPGVVLRTTVRNDSQSASTQALTYRYRISHSGSWTNEFGVPLPSSALAEVDTPFLVDGRIIIENHSQLNSDVDTTTSSVSVPASTRGVASVLINRARIQVPFTYTEKVWYVSGEYTEKIKNGIYSDVVTNGVDIQLTDLINITHTIPVVDSTSLNTLQASQGSDFPS